MFYIKAKMHAWGFRYWILLLYHYNTNHEKNLIVVMLILSHCLHLHLASWCSLTLPLPAGERLTFKCVEFWSQNQHFFILIHSAIHSPDKTLSITGHCNLSCALYLDLLRLVKGKTTALTCKKIHVINEEGWGSCERDRKWEHKWGERNMNDGMYNGGSEVH